MLWFVRWLLSIILQRSLRTPSILSGMLAQNKITAVDPEHCCEKCFSENFIVNFIKQCEMIGHCNFCQSSDVYIAELSLVGQFIREGILRKYEPYREEEDPHGLIQVETISLSDIFEYHSILSDIYDHSSQRYSLIDALIRSSGPSDHEKVRGSTDALEQCKDTRLVDKESEIPLRENWIFETWSLFKQRVKHFNRFFDLGAEQQARIKTLDLLAKLFHQQASELVHGSLLWRCRSLPDDLRKRWLTMSASDLQNEIGPAPISLAKRNRMSPVGIPILYMGDTPQTCIAESRVPVGDRVCLGKFLVEKQLRIIDLSSNQKRLTDSIFSEDYIASKQICLEFLDEFIREISMPISDKDQELDYLATQVLTEFIRLKNFDGVKWRSTQNTDGYNYALFCGPIAGYPQDFYPGNKLPHYDEWMHLVEFGIDIVGPVDNNSEGRRYFTKDDFREKAVSASLYINGHPLYPL